MEKDDVLIIEATDPASVIDIQHYCDVSGNQLIEKAESDGVFTYRIKKSL